MARKTQAETQETRQTLLRAGLTVFSQQGYAATRLENVAQEAGATRSGDGFFVESTRRVMIRMLAYLEEDETYRAGAEYRPGAAA